MGNTELDTIMMRIGINTAYADFYFAVAENFSDARKNMEKVENDELLSNSKLFSKAYRVTIATLVKDYVNDKNITDYERSYRISVMKKLVRLRMKVRLRKKYANKN